MTPGTPSGPLWPNVTYRLSDVVPVVLEGAGGPALPPVLDPVGLRVLLALPVGKAALGQHLRDHVRHPQVDLKADKVKVKSVCSSGKYRYQIQFFFKLISNN